MRWFPSIDDKNTESLKSILEITKPFKTDPCMIYYMFLQVLK